MSVDTSERAVCNCEVVRAAFAEIEADRDRLAADVARLRGALEAVRAAITNENNINGGAIIDTIWVSAIETAVDHIDAALTGDTP